MNSQLLNQLMVVRENNEGSPMRRPPQAVLEQIRLLAMELHLSHRLCKSREPDFLLDIIKQQGTSQSMSWLSELVKSSENSFELLPAPCLCEFLLQDIQNTKRPVLLKRLQSIILGSSDPAQTLEIVSYFTSKLSASYTVRYRAIKGLKTIFNRRLDDSNEGWLLGDLVNIPQHNHVKDTVCEELVKALSVEHDGALLESYLVYICKHSPKGARRAAALSIAGVFAARSHVMYGVVGKTVLPCLSDLFLEYINGSSGKKRGGGGGEMIPLKNGEHCVETVIVQAVLVLMTCQGKGNFDRSPFKSILLPKPDFLAPHAGNICTPFLIPRLLDSNIPSLQSLAITTLTDNDMVELLQSFSITETAATYLLKQLNKDSKFWSRVEGDEELLVHIQAWNISGIPGLENLRKVKCEPIEDNFAKEEMMEVTPVDNRDWTDYVREIFEEDSVSSQNYLMMCCLQNRNVEEICLTLFVWAQDREIPRKHHPFLEIALPILSEKCRNKDILVKLQTALKEKCRGLLKPKKSAGGSGLLDLWCSDPSSEDFNSVLSALELLDLSRDAVKAGGTWRRAIKTAIRNNGQHGIELEKLINLIVKQMMGSPNSAGLFMDWLHVLSPDLKCVKLFLEAGDAVPVSLQRGAATMRGFGRVPTVRGAPTRAS
eukprot:sb/3462825/